MPDDSGVRLPKPIRATITLNLCAEPTPPNELIFNGKSYAIVDHYLRDDGTVFVLADNEDSISKVFIEIDTD